MNNSERRIYLKMKKLKTELTSHLKGGEFSDGFKDSVTELFNIQPKISIIKEVPVIKKRSYKKKKNVSVVKQGVNKS